MMNARKRASPDPAMPHNKPTIARSRFIASYLIMKPASIVRATGDAGRWSVRVRISFSLTHLADG